MPGQQLRARNAFYWSVPFTVVAISAYALVKARAATVIPHYGHPLRYVPCGERKKDKESLERVRAEWRERNHGIGLRDVSRSGGGV